MTAPRRRCSMCWFSVYGQVGLRSPVCVRCGRPNPRPLDEIEQREYDYWCKIVRERRVETS